MVLTPEELKVLGPTFTAAEAKGVAGVSPTHWLGVWRGQECIKIDDGVRFTPEPGDEVCLVPEASVGTIYLPPIDDERE